MAMTPLRAATQIRRWFRRADGYLLLTLDVAGTEQVSTQLWRESQVDSLEGHPGEVPKAAAYEIWGWRTEAPSGDLYTMDLIPPH